MVEEGLDIDDDGINQGLFRIDKSGKTADRDEADGESDAALPDELRNLSFVWKEGDERVGV
jgi:hypothetical protein